MKQIITYIKVTNIKKTCGYNFGIPAGGDVALAIRHYLNGMKP